MILISLVLVWNCKTLVFLMKLLSQTITNTIHNYHYFLSLGNVRAEKNKIVSIEEPFYEFHAVYPFILALLPIRILSRNSIIKRQTGTLWKFTMNFLCTDLQDKIEILIKKVLDFLVHYGDNILINQTELSFPQYTPLSHHITSVKCTPKFLPLS